MHICMHSLTVTTAPLVLAIARMSASLSYACSHNLFWTVLTPAAVNNAIHIMYNSCSTRHKSNVVRNACTCCSHTHMPYCLCIHYMWSHTIIFYTSCTYFARMDTADSRVVAKQGAGSIFKQMPTVFGNGKHLFYKNLPNIVPISTIHSTICQRHLDVSLHNLMHSFSPIHAFSCESLRAACCRC